MAVKVGLCGFTIGADTYAKTFPVVEVQQTFYDPPTDARLQIWRDRAPADFEFTMKAWQVITHFGTSRTYRRLKSPFSDQQRAEAGGFRVTPTVLGAWQRTREAAAILRATAILFQCPASFRPTPENAAAMREFFATVERPAHVQLMWEPRGAWPDELVLGLCTDLGLVHVPDPFLRPALTSSPTYWRLHGNKSHYASYTDDELRQLVEWLPESGEVYVMFNNIPRVGDSRRFLELIGAAMERR